jgi:phage terminase large subunit-like protein
MKYIQKAAQYADDVLDGTIPACKHVRNACQRFINDLQRKDIYLDEAAAEKWCAFLELLPHTKGKWAAKKENLILSPWQVFIVVNIYGFKWKHNGRRRFREAFILVPRKNGKSMFVGGLGLGHLVLDNEYGAEIYCGATTEKQAWEVFRPAKQMCERTPELVEWAGIEINAKVLNILRNGSRFEPVIGNPGDGSSPSCAIADEFHEHANSDQVDTFITGMGAREQPLMIYISTAGQDMGGPCYAKQDEVAKILDGSIKDDTIFGIIYGLDTEDQWDTIDAQRKANPNFGVSVDEEFLIAQLAQARRSATKQSAYKTKHLNVWVGAKQAWMNMLAYQAARKANLDIAQFEGRRCYAALDLASKIDFAVKILFFPPEDGKKSAVFATHYMPEDRIYGEGSANDANRAKSESGNSRYKAWHQDGWIVATPGNVIDYEYIEDDLIEDRSRFEIIEVPYDPFQATQFAIRMQEEGFQMVEVGATVKNFSEPMKELEAMILKKAIQFEMDPVLLWMFSNVVAKLDKKDNIFPDKAKPENKIDGVVALIMAINRFLTVKEMTSVYENRGIRTL